MKLLVLVLALVAFSSAEIRQCNAPNGGGINGIIDEVSPIVPKLELFFTVVAALTDPAMQPLREYLTSDDFADSLRVLEKQEAFISIVKVACEELFFDGLYYYNKMAEELGTPLIHRPVRSVRGLQRGVLGLLNDIMALLPQEKLHKIFEEKVKTDTYVQKALKIVYSEDFKEKIEALTALPEYDHFLSKLRAIGVEVDEISKMVNDLIKKLASYVPKA